MVVGEIRGGRDPCTLGGLLPLQWIYSRPRLHCAQQLTSSFQARQGSRGAPHLSRGLCTLLRPFTRRQRAGPRLAHLPGGRPVYIHRVRLQVLSSRELGAACTYSYIFNKCAGLLTCILITYVPNRLG